MKRRTPDLLLEIPLLLHLFMHLLFPMGDGTVTRILLDQFKAVHATRQAEKRLLSDQEEGGNEALKGFFRAFLIQPDNAVAYTYVELLAPELGWFDRNIQAIRYKVDNDNFEFSTNAVDQLITGRIQINEIKESIANGQLVAGENGENRSYIICGLTQGQRAFCIKCSFPNRPVFNIIAIHEIDRELWNDNFTPRINSHDV